MTPLPWWVLLATLLGRAIGVPVHDADDACVPFCRSRHNGPVELCNANEPVLQYDGTHVGARSALGLCLAPCTTAPDEFRARSYLEELQICRALRDSFAEVQGCACEIVHDPQYESSLSTDRRRVANNHGNIVANYNDVIRSADEELREFLKELKTFRVRGEVAEVDTSKSPKLNLDRPAIDTMKGVRRMPSRYSIRRSHRGGERSENVGGLAITTTEASSSEEEAVDWDLWCMAQCDNGQGGSACKCDIIP